MTKFLIVLVSVNILVTSIIVYKMYVYETNVYNYYKTFSKLFENIENISKGSQKLFELNHI